MPLPTHSNLSKQGLHALQRIIVAAHCNVRQAEGRALDSARAGEALLSGGAALHLSYRSGGAQWTLSTGEAVSDAVARVLIANPNIVGVGDALFAGELSQTWRWEGDLQ